VCFIICKITLELEHTILATLYLAGAKNTYSWRAKKGDLQCAFPLEVLIVYSLKLSFVANTNNPTSIGLTPGETIWFGSLEFTVDRLACLSLSPEEGDSGTIFVGMVHSGLLSLHTTLDDSSNEGDATSGVGGSSGSLIPLGCNVITPTVPITTTLVPKNTPALLTILMVTVQTTTPQLGMELLLDQQ
jgi:hypothetical protein